jgi:Tfp pilus assembly protein PilN
MSVLAPPESAAPAPEPAAAVSASRRIVAIRADLVPEELVLTRRIRELKRRIMIGLAGLLVVLIVWYAVSGLGTSSARDDLSSAQQSTTDLHRQQAKFAPVVSAQAQATQISSSLQQLMVGDVRWESLLARIRASAKNGVVVANIDASMAAIVDGTGLSVLNQTGKQAVGTLTISGTAKDQNAVAAYVEALGKVKGLAAPFPANVSNFDQAYAYSISVIITADALGGRYVPTKTGGK